MDTISIKGLELLKSFEKCSLTPIKNSLGSYYIGYRHITNSKQKPITQEEADKLLLEDCQLYADYLDKQDIYLTPNQRDALIIFGFDCKIFGLSRIIMDSFHETKLLSENLLKYIHSLDGRSSEELYQRRVAERKLFLS